MLQTKLLPDVTKSPEHARGVAALLSWECYLIVLVAAFLRFYQINTTEFDEDQAMLFRLAHEAVQHGLLPTTSNAASIGISNPPGVIYLLMLVAAFTANPLWGALLVGLFTTLAALLTYLFTRRYYGRFAATVAALLYATAAIPLNYARFIWQPNLMPPFVVLFLFALFAGVVERHKGWFFPALVLFGVLYQMHPTTVLLAAPLLCALLLSPGTLRWRDLGFALLTLLVLFFPYLLWEFSIKFADLRTVFMLAKQHAHIDTQALHFYQLFLSPYTVLPIYPGSVVRQLARFLSWLHDAVPLLAIGGFLTAGVLLLRPSAQAQSLPSASSPLPHWLRTFRADSYRCGLLVLLVWQLVPLAVLSRHSVDLHAQYFFMLMPGPFILIGLFLSKLPALFNVIPTQARVGQAHTPTNVGVMPNPLMLVVALVVLIVIAAQFVGSTAAVIDASSGRFDDRSFQPYPYHNDLQSLQHALSEADQLAQSHHFNRVYVTTDTATQTALRYLAEQMQTPTTLFDATRCLVLPNLADGPAVLLVGPYDTLTHALLSQFAQATLVDKPARLGGNPFSLYIVNPPAVQPGSAQHAFAHHLQFIGTNASVVTSQNASWLVTRWSLLQAEPAALRTTYSYQFKVTTAPNQNTTSVCTLTTMRPGDLLLAAFPGDASTASASSLTMQAVFYVTTPYNPTYGPFHLETDSEQSTPWVSLLTASGNQSMTVPIAQST
jgi:4-amino-4-deoxy-L-arabinose transferase-like glycosyltransferase